MNTHTASEPFQDRKILLPHNVLSTCFAIWFVVAFLVYFCLL